jgi:septal ring factor EnvC (AmiA/AmiB activator)
MKILISLVIVAALASPALAQQQQPDQAFMQAAIAALQAQRNQAMDNLAASEAKSAMATEQIGAARGQVSKLTFENTKLKAENEALKKGQDKTNDGKP